MATISENLQILKDSTDAIKQAIIDKGGTIEGDITTWADAISELSGGVGSDNLKIFSFNIEGVSSGYRTRVYVDGMTWSEWVDSIYNTRDIFGTFIKGGDKGLIYCSMGSVFRDNGAVQIYASNLISDSITYIITTQGGSVGGGAE